MWEVYHRANVLSNADPEKLAAHYNWFEGWSKDFDRDDVIDKYYRCLEKCINRVAHPVIKVRSEHKKLLERKAELERCLNYVNGTL